MNPPDRTERDRLRLAMDADRLSGLLPLLDAAAGAVLAGRYRIEGVLAVGRQSQVFVARELAAQQEVVVKQANFDYRHPVRYGRAEVARLRAVLEREHDVLCACRTGHLPAPRELLRAPAIVPAAGESPLLADEEVFLVEERIIGRPLTRLALDDWPAHPPAWREEQVRRLTAEFVRFWESLHEAGWHYGDVSAGNCLVEQDTGRLRLVDAGSCVPATETVILPGFTPAFLTPALLAALSRHEPLPGTLASVLPAWAKVVHFALTRRQPFNGALPDLDDPLLSRCSEASRRALSALLALDGRPESLPEARSRLAEWLAPLEC
jgi:serine/threonine protein kinase